MGESQATQGKKAKNGRDRTRNFAFIVYPDSAPADWVDILTEYHVEALISPLHDKDINPDGAQKKPHYHVLVMFTSVKTVEQAQVVRDSVGGVGWEIVASTRGYARYLCHLDNPEKAQYNPDDVRELGGADYAEIIRRASDSVRLLGEIIDFCNAHNVLYYSEFLEFCKLAKPDWFEAVTSRHTYAVYTYIKARAHRHNEIGDSLPFYIDPETGELLTSLTGKE